MAKVNPETDDVSETTGSGKHSSSFNFEGITGKDVTSGTYGSSTTSGTHMITNGICAFSPTSTKGKWIFLVQTIILSFTPIAILLLQNSTSFYSLMVEKQNILTKNKLVNDAMGLSRFVLAMQWERAAVSLSVFLDAKSGKTTDLSKEYAMTDKALRSVKWREFGPEKVFDNPLRFQIRIDDFRNKVTNMNQNVKKGDTSGKDMDEDMNDQVIMDFYNLATGRLLTGLEKDLGAAQSAANWKILMSYFNMIQCLESAGIGLVYGLRFYSVGLLPQADLINYFKTKQGLFCAL